MVYPVAVIELLEVIAPPQLSAPHVIAFAPQVKVPLDVIEAAENVPLAVILSVFKSPHVAAFIPHDMVPDELTDAHASAPHVIAFDPQLKVPLDVIEAAEKVPLAVILSDLKSPQVIAFVPQEKVPDALTDVHVTAAHVMGWSTMVLQ
jgi:hypothetical protein